MFYISVLNMCEASLGGEFDRERKPGQILCFRFLTPNGLALGTAC